MIHRAIFGSFERFIAIITEHYGGKWPFWLSPRQVAVLPVSVFFRHNAECHTNRLAPAAGSWASADCSWVPVGRTEAISCPSFFCS